jgi:CRISPR-associated protein Csx10
MKSYFVEVTLESPVIVAMRMATGHLLSGTDHIPGSALRGAVAGLFSGSESVDAFKPGGAAHRIFVEEQVYFPFLYPAAGSSVQPIRRSALSCKHFQGFSGTSGSHGVVDILLSEPKPENERCAYPDCGAQREGYEGYYSRPNGTYGKISAHFRRIAHTAVSVERHVVKPGSLYTYEALDAYPLGSNQAQSFSGIIKTDEEEWIHNIRAKLDQKDNVLYLGKASTRGYGRVRVYLSDEPEQVDDDILDRLDGLNRKALRQVDGQGFYFTLSLDSEAVLLDSILRHKAFINGGDLADATECDLFHDYELIRHFSSCVPVRTWNGKMGLPGQVEIAIRKGSCFLFHTEKTDKPSIELINALSKLEEDGLGERLSEGFGRLTVSDRFHWEGGL